MNNYSIPDLNKYNTYLNHLVKSKDYTTLIPAMHNLLNEVKLINNSPTKLHLCIKLTRKQYLKICSGKKCFFSPSASTSNPSSLIRTSCCNFHYYCKKCLHDYIIRTLSLDRNTKVGCEACEAIGSKNTKECMDDLEIKTFISEEEFDYSIREGLRRQYLPYCVAGYSHCQFNLTPMIKDQYKSFKCCNEKICLSCFGTAVDVYLREKIRIIEEDPKSLHGTSLPIVCIRGHSQTGVYLSFDEIKEIINHSASPEFSKSELLSKYEENLELFRDGVIKFCFNCKKLFIEEIRNKCKYCGKCAICSKEYHKRISCDKFHKLIHTKHDRSDILQPPKNENDKNFHRFIVAVKHLRKSGLKIINFEIVDASGLFKMMNDDLKRNGRKLNHQYLFGNIYSINDYPDIREYDMALDLELFEGLSSHNNGLYCLYSISEAKIRDKCPCKVIMYKVLYERQEKYIYPKRYHNYEDELILHESDGDYYFMDKYAAIPDLVLEIDLIS